MRSVLIIEPSVRRKKRIRTIVQSAGLNTWEASSGTEGLRMAGRHDFQAIIMDIHPPDMDGLALLRRIKSNNHQAEIILLCNVASLDSLRPLVDPELAAIVNKDAPAYFLRRQLEALLDRGNASREEK